MVIKNCTTNVSFGPRRYAAPGSNGETYTVTQFHDGMWTCECAHFCKRIRNPVPVKYGCKHMRNAENGDYGKPHCRVQHKPARPTVRRVTVSEAMRDRLSMLDV